MSENAYDLCIKFLYACEIDRVYFFNTHKFKYFSQNLPGRVEDEEFDEWAAQDARRVLGNVSRLDSMFQELSAKWSLDRIPPVDLAIIRHGMMSIEQGREEVRLIITRAMNYSKKFGGEKSHKFINGVLDSYAKKLAA